MTIGINTPSQPIYSPPSIFGEIITSGIKHIVANNNITMYRTIKNINIAKKYFAPDFSIFLSVQLIKTNSSFSILALIVCK